MKRRPRLYPVGQDPSDVFSDIEKLRTDLAAPLRRQRAVETFARIPHDRALELYRHKLSGTAWLVLIELDRILLKARGKNPVRFWSPRLRKVVDQAHAAASLAPTRSCRSDQGRATRQRAEPVGGTSLVPVFGLSAPYTVAETPPTTVAETPPYGGRNATPVSSLSLGSLGLLSDLILTLVAPP
jgi:hypothetical protein